MITVIASNILFLLLGITIGFYLNVKRVTEAYEKLREKHLRGDVPKPGVIHRPTAEQIKERGTLLGESKDAMRDVLDKDPYLHENIR